MKLIIDISEEDYRECKFRKDLLSLGGEPTDLTFNMRMETLIANGTPLPKGHGDLIDRDKLVYDCSLGDGGCDHICRCDGCSYNIIRETTINKAKPIIEADKGE